MPSFLALALFVLTYLGLALGRVPGLALDRTGFAMLGALAFLATGSLSLEQAQLAIDGPTIAILFGLMLLSALYERSGLYALIAARLAQVASPRRLLTAVVLAGAGLSAVLTNDVTCFALTPPLVAALLRVRPDGTRLDPLPYLLALACASNIGSALTPIGNPQNILIAARLGVHFVPFVAACLLPILLSLAVLTWLCGRRLRTLPAAVGSASSPPPAVPPRPLDRQQAAKAVLLTVAAIVLFATPIPMHLTALGVGGLVLTSRRMHTREALALVDWHMLALFVSLFAVMRGFEISGWSPLLAGELTAAVDLEAPWVLAPIVALLGNLVGNVPAVMMLLPLVPSTSTVAYTLALASTFAGNALLIGSVANLIVAEQARRLGVEIGVREHAAIGLPVTLVSLLAIVPAALLW